MSWLWIILGLAALAILIALAYWQLIIAEGAYLGPRVVAWTYDLVASRYDSIKRFQPHDESWFVAGPLLRGLVGIEHPLVLDVATGTGRLPLALLRERFRGQIVGLDLSSGMLRQARRKLRPYADQVCLIWQDANKLPFDDDTFDAVTCMESLEFMPQPLGVLTEMIRVLAPGGILLLTNRVGHEARFLPRRAIPRPELQRALDDLPLSEFEVRPWQVNYDMAIGRKAGSRMARTDAETRSASLVRCPGCGGSLHQHAAALSCSVCVQSYPLQEGLIHLAPYQTQATDPHSASQL
jgi:ubiquinone/menaquinone biosynthesis C-methylase UbiE